LSSNQSRERDGDSESQFREIRQILRDTTIAINQNTINITQLQNIMTQSGVAGQALASSSVAAINAHITKEIGKAFNTLGKWVFAAITVGTFLASIAVEIIKLVSH